MILPGFTPANTAKGAAKSVAPFAFWLFLTAVLAGSPNRQVLATACPADHTGERVQVVFVYDGDTVKLQDGRRLRFIGINTPETEHHGKSMQPLGQAARTSLTKLLDSNNRTLLLQYGTQRKDHYGRLLAHAFLENGENIAARLLQQGLATTLVVPPNTWGQDCYQGLENSARAAGLGLWALEHYQPHAARSLSPDTRGFRIINGRVTGIRRTRHNIWLDLEGPLAVQLPVKELANFGTLDVDSLAGRTVTVRGWLKPDRDRLKLKVQHPSALVIMAPSQHP